MGYYSTVTGELEATNRNGSSDRPSDIEHDVINAAFDKEIDRSNAGYWVSDIDAAFGGYSISYGGDSGKAYEIEKDVQEVVDFFVKRGFDVSGKLQIEGEETGDFSRVTVVDNKAKFEKAKVTITFSDGSTWDD